MTGSLEQAMKAQLDGHFYSFTHCNHKGTFISEKQVTVDFVPTYSFENPFLAGSKRGGYNRGKLKAQFLAETWTPERVKELRRLRKLGWGTKRINKAIGISRDAITEQLKRMGL